LAYGDRQLSVPFFIRAYIQKTFNAETQSRRGQSFNLIWLSTLLKLGTDWFITFSRGRQTRTTTRQNQNRPHAEARRAQRKTALGKVLSFISYSAISASQESKANGRESGRLLFQFHVFRCFTGAKQITRKSFSSLHGVDDSTSLKA
jgi:hypothetical protein